MTKKITTLSMGEFGINPPPLEADFSKQSKERLIQYASMESLIKLCVNNAEDIKDRLLTIALQIQKPKDEEEKKTIMRAGFMKLKNIFLNDVRESKIYKQFEKYNSTGKLKPFSDSLNTFVLDRNKYTHGHLCFIKPNYDFALEYIESESQQKKYAHINTNILLSYNSYYKEILKVITEYNIIHQTKRLEDYRNKQI